MTNYGEPSALLTATWGNAQACAMAAKHVKTCPVCPADFGRFLDGIGTICDDGLAILRCIAASELDIARAVQQPLRKDVAF